ncbi:MAG: hypothetical protein DELT_00198 [Desulfovibrio sp.]
MPNQPSDTSSMDQVRELLMGSQLKEMESRLQRQEENFLREIASMRDTIQGRVDSLENFMKSESASLLHRLQEEKAERANALKTEQKERAEAIKGEQKERSDALKNEQKERVESVKHEQKDREEALARFAKDLAAREDALDRRLTALSGTLDTAEQELRQLMLSENARLSQTMEEKYKEALNALSNTSLQIRHDVVSRSAISAMFAEAAMRFSGQLPEEEKQQDNAQPDES